VRLEGRFQIEMFAIENDVTYLNLQNLLAPDGTGRKTKVGSLEYLQEIRTQNLLVVPRIL
jgi:hypothetical protein